MVDRVPVWVVMRQAGRYLLEFREVRVETDFFTVCQTPKLACKMTLQPTPSRESLDILVIPQALGMKVEMKPGVGPVLDKPLVVPEDMDTLIGPDVKLEGKVPLIGFTGAPWPT